MNAGANEELRSLAAHAGRWNVSMMMTSHPMGATMTGDPVAFRNLVRRAERLLAERGADAETTAATMKPAWELLDTAEFWKRPNSGIAVFANESFFKAFHVPLRLPEYVSVGDGFYLKPLASLLANEEVFYLLALSQNNVRLFKGTRDTFEQLPMDGVPGNLSEALGADTMQRQLQMHSGARSSSGEPAIFHGGGGVEDHTKSDLLKFFQQVDRGVRERIGAESAPLVLAGVEYLMPIYRQASHYGALAEHGLAGNPDHTSPRVLHTRGWELVEPLARRRSAEAVERLRSLLGTGRASSDVAELAAAATEGRVETLFVGGGGAMNGGEPASPADGDRAVNVALLATVRNGGTVFVVDPSQIAPDPAAAIYRY